MNKQSLEKAREQLISNVIEILSVKQILDTDFGPEVWAIDQLVPQGSITAITGMPGSYKTWLTLEIARCISRGSDFLGHFKTNLGKVLIIDKENNIRYIQKRLKALGVDDDAIYYFKRPENFFIDDKKSFDTLLDIIKGLKIDLVIFDSFVRMHNGDENEARAVSKIIAAFRKMTGKGPTVIFIHHNRKESASTQGTTNSVRGSSDIIGGIDSLIQVRKRGKCDLMIQNSKQRYGEELDAFKVKIITSEDKGSIAFSYAGAADTDSFDVEKAIEEMLDILSDGVERPRKQLTKELVGDYGPSVIAEALSIISKTKKVKRNVGAHNKYSYAINIEPSA